MKERKEEKATLELGSTLNTKKRMIRLLLTTFLCALASKSTAIFQCREQTRCGALVGYKSRDPTTLGAIQRLFNVSRAADILAANGLPEWTIPDNFTVDQKRVTRIPFECDCTEPESYGKATNPPVYKVRMGENISDITTTVFSGLVNSLDIQYGNNISNLDSLFVGQELRIPLPCSCGKVNGVGVVHFGLTLEYGLTLEQIGEEYHIDSETLWSLNPASNPNFLLGTAVDIPLPGSSFFFTVQCLLSRI
ncbi:unnamed protein product [Sphenostylis stenocarpa]|uniref:LysM domain-containing protein n=1 Tax=Sphenostylis stenocarpa TaxID=92480 RepID=A0AA86T7T9_9FABA|nr:unnamed protein product [Sphenostylis stenocarpa]